MKRKGKHLTSGARRNVKKRKEKKKSNTSLRQLSKPSKTDIRERALEIY